MKNPTRAVVARLAATVIAITLLASAAPAAATALGDTSPGTVGAKFASRLDPKPLPIVKLGRVLVPETPADKPVPEVEPAKPAAPLAASTPQVADERTPSLTSVVVMAQAEIPVAVQTPAKPRTSTSSTSTQPVRRATSQGDETAQARAILSGLIARYPILAGATVTIGETPNNYQAVAYYKSGRIVVNPAHRTSLERILNHEVWHIIDWRDNGQIDWGENIPPNQ